MDTIETTSPRAWVGCLGCYNAGALNGAWLEGAEAGDIAKAVKVIERESYFGEGLVTICAKCGSDEFWVFDHEGFEGLIKGECSPMEAQEKAELLESVEEGEREAFRAWISATDNTDPDAMREAYVGQFDSYTELAEYFIDECQALEIPESVARYFDYEAYGRDLSYDLTEAGNFYFWNH